MLKLRTYERGSERCRHSNAAEADQSLGSVKNYSVDPRLDYRTVSAINGYVFVFG